MENKTDSLRESLFYEPKNGYDRITTEERLKVEDYSRGYMDFLNSCRTEREAVRYAIREAEAKGFREQDLAEMAAWYREGRIRAIGDRKSTRLNSSH